MEKNFLKSLLILPDKSIKQGMQKLSETFAKILFVVNEDDKLLGTVTDGDIRRGIINGIRLNTALKEIMNTKFISVNINCPNLKNKAKELMQKHLIEQVPVIDDNGLIIDAILWFDCLSHETEYQEKPKTTMKIPVIIMAGGKGTRLDPFTKILPKSLIPFGDKVIIEHIMDRFYKNGFYKFILILNYRKEMIKMYLNENKPPYDIKYIEENDYFGTAGGLFLLKNMIKETFIVTNCDTILEGEYVDFYNWHKERNNLITIVGTHKEITLPYGVINMENGLLLDIDEKPKFDFFINTGTYVFEPDILKFINDCEPIDMDKLIYNVKSIYKEKVGIFPHWGGWFDIGQWEEYKKSLKHLGEKVDDAV